MRIKYTKISYTNFKHAYNNKTITHSLEGDYILKGKNGIGKTTLLDAIAYLWTSKSSSNTTLGLEPLDSNNNRITDPIHIVLDLFYEEKKYTIDLLGNIRRVNDIAFKTKNDFDIYIKTTFGFDPKDYFLLSSPLYLLGTLSKDEARKTFLKDIETKELLDRIVEEFNKAAKDYNIEYRNAIIERLDTFKPDELVTSFIKDLNVYNNASSVMKSKIDALQLVEYRSNEEEEELKKLDKLSENIFLKKMKEDQINSLLKSSKCSLCGSVLKEEKELELAINELRNEVSLYEEQLKEYDESKHTNLKNKPKNDGLLDTHILEYEKANELVIKYNAYKDLANLYNEIYAANISNLFSEDKKLGFELKLFETLKNNTIRPTFTVTHNGVDYKYLNAAKKIIIGLEILIKYNPSLILPIYIDECERLSPESLEEVKLLSGEAQLVLAIVDNAK